MAEKVGELRERLARWTAPQGLMNSSEPARAFDDATWERLRAVRETYDPDRRLVSAYA